MPEMFQAANKKLHFAVGDAVMIMRELEQASRSMVIPLNLTEIASSMDCAIRTSLLENQKTSTKTFPAIYSTYKPDVHKASASSKQSLKIQC